MSTKPLPPHGSLSRHKYHKCKCPTCREGYCQYQRSRYRKQGYGTWQPYVDAEPVRQHLLALRQQGISYTRVAELAGLHPPTVGAFLYDLGPSSPRKKRARPETAAKILAVTAETALPAVTDTTGTRRRLQALAVNGWPMHALGPHIGVHPATVSRLLHQSRIYTRTVQAVAACYTKLADERPEAHGVAPEAATKARNRAQRNGWLGPEYWDDEQIDDPAFTPERHRLDGRDGLASYRRYEIRHLASFGLPEHEIAARLGMAPAYVHDLIRDMRSAA